MNHNENGRGQRVYPVIDAEQRVIGVLTRRDLKNVLQAPPGEQTRSIRLAELVSREPVVAYPEEPLRLVVNRMAATGLTRFPVVKPGNQLVGLIALQDLLKAREFSLETEHHRERVLRLRVPPSLRWRRVDNKPEDKTEHVG